LPHVIPFTSGASSFPQQTERNVMTATAAPRTTSARLENVLEETPSSVLPPSSPVMTLSATPSLANVRSNPSPMVQDVTISTVAPFMTVAVMEPASASQ